MLLEEVLSFVSGRGIVCYIGPTVFFSRIQFQTRGKEGGERERERRGRGEGGEREGKGEGEEGERKEREEECMDS